jgi:TRAP-type mannitol/chloroaromatic compound transport system substrate-binding protein
MYDNPNRPPDGPLAPPPPPPPPPGKDTIEEIASTLRDLFNRVPETVNKAVERAINVKDTTVLTRMSDESSDKLDKLVAAGVFKNRMEAASFLLEEGIKAQAPLFQRIQDKLAEIERIRAELRNSVAPET